MQYEKGENKVKCLVQQAVDIVKNETIFLK